MFNIPPNIEAVLLPGKKMCILDLVQYSIPTPDGPNLDSSCDNTLFSIIPSLMQTPDQVSFVRGLPMPPRKSLMALKVRIQQAPSAIPPWQSLAYPFHGQTVRLPFWAMTYWKEAYEILDDKKLWSNATSWIKTEKAYLPYGIFDALRSLSWKCFMLQSRAEVREAALLLSNGYIPTSVVDELTGRLSMRLEKDDQCGILRMPKTYLVTLGIAYQAALIDDMSEYRRHKWLEQAGIRIQEGNVSRIYLVLGVLTANRPHCEATDLMKTGTDKQGNHYMAIVIDIKKTTLAVGDSLGFWVPPEFV
jgi:hypothetical protein